jgi:hypothetical protein
VLQLGDKQVCADAFVLQVSPMLTCTLFSLGKLDLMGGSIIV